jgi:hypothetical protein
MEAKPTPSVAAAIFDVIDATRPLARPYLAVPWWTYKLPPRPLTEDDKALHRAIGAVKRERGQNASPPNTGLNSDA